MHIVGFSFFACFFVFSRGRTFNTLSAVGALMTLIDFTLSNARRFYSSMRNPLAVKGLIKQDRILLIAHGKVSISAFQDPVFVADFYWNT